MSYVYNEESTFCQMISTQWEQLGQKPEASVISSGRI